MIILFIFVFLKYFSAQNARNCFPQMSLKNFLCISQFQAPTSPPGLTPGEFFKVVKFPAPGAENFCEIRARGKKNRQNPRPWGQFCGPSRQFCHDRETIRIFLVLFFSLAFFEFFQRLYSLRIQNFSVIAA